MFIVQRERGYLDPPGVLYLANRLRLRVTDIWEVATFYSMIHTSPSASITFRSAARCRARSWARERSPNTVQRNSESSPVKPPDGRFTLSEVECLGSCGTAPMFQINFDYHENLTPEKIDQDLDALP